MDERVLNYRLKAGVADKHPVNVVKFSLMAAWHKGRFPGQPAMSPRTWTAMRKGGVVKRNHVEVLARYLSRNLPPADRKHTVESLADAVYEPTTTDYGHDADLWKALWGGLREAADVWGSPAEAEALAVPRSEREVRQLAQALVIASGRAKGADDEAQALTVGQQLLGRPAQAMGDLLARVWRVQPRAAMWAVARKPDKQLARCGVAVVVPVTEAAFDAFCAGNLDPLDLAAADLRPRSPHLLLLGASPDLPVAGLKSVDQRNAPLLTAAYLAARLYPDLAVLRSPRLALPITTERNAVLAEMWGYERTGGMLNGVHPIVVMENPRRPRAVTTDRPGRRGTYKLFLGSLLSLQGFVYMARLTCRAGRKT